MERTIDLIYSELVQKLMSTGLIQTLSYDFFDLKTNSEKTNFALRIMEQMNFLPENRILSKSEKLADEYRSQGNLHYSKERYYEALQYYNLALLHAPYDSSQMWLAYSNRSAVLFNLHRHIECCHDIKTVMNSKNYPKTIKEKLQKRQKLSEEYLNQQHLDKLEQNEYISKILKPMEERNPKYICASSKLDVNYSEEMGRHVVAIEDIEVGEILAIEEPYSQYLLKSKALLCCNRCFSITANLIPCNTCCIAMFCSEECRERANKEYHHVECSIGVTLALLDFTKLELLALRTVVKSRCERNSWQDLLDTVRNAEQGYGMEHAGVVNTGDQWLYDSKNYETIHTLSTNEEYRTVSDRFQKAVSAGVLFHLLSQTSFMCDGGEEAYACVAGNLLRHMMTVPTNTHSISPTVYAADRTCVSSVDVGSAAYGFLSLLNHSCAPNVGRLTGLGTATTTLVALRRIKRGIQVFDNYGYHHALQSREDRRSSLKSQYKFTCMCEACTGDWPTYLNSVFSLNTLFKKNLPQELVNLKARLLCDNTIDKLKRGDVKVAMKQFKSLCHLAEQLEDFVPCVEIGETQEALKQCAFICTGVMEFGYTQEIDWVKILKENIHK